MKKLILIIACFLSLEVANAKSYNDILNSWVGVPAENLIKKWSYPTRTFQSPNGNIIYAYERASQMTLPTFQMPSTTFNNQYRYSRYGTIDMGSVQNGMNVGGQTFTMTCNTYFEINQDQVIVGGTWQGNSCK